jgi:hypothetical protein
VANLNTRVNNLRVGNGTNWSSGLNIVFARDNNTLAGASYGVDQADLIVFVTDGDPNVGRNATTGASVSMSSDAATTQAQSIANNGRSNGTEIIGVMVGPSVPSSASVARLKRVVGPDEWTGRVNPDGTIEAGNAATADLFRGSFAQLGDVLRSILIAECGGTLTLQKRILVGGVLTTPTTGSFTFDPGLGTRTLDTAETASVTFDYTFARGEVNKTVQVREVMSDGRVFRGAQCSAGGVPIDSPLLTDGTAGVSVTVSVDKAVSCLMISE